MTPAEVLAKVLEAGGQVIPDPERPRLLVPASLKPWVVEYREALRRLILADPPGETVELARRVEAFRRQLAAWTGPGVPLLTLPDSPEPQRGGCVSCGEPAPEGWRCDPCFKALYLALGMVPPEERT